MAHNKMGFLLLAGLVLTACSVGTADETPARRASDVTAATDEPAFAKTVRLGYLPNVTDAPAIVGVVEGLFAEELGDTALEVATFNAGTGAVEALFAGAIDMAFVGPNPAINAFAQSEGRAIRIVSGATSGGVFLVVDPAITSPGDLAGATLSSPSVGNTQDVALRAWLADQGYETTLEGGGDVSITPQSSSQILDTFIAGEIDGAWVPEPWATRLVLEGGGHVLVDEAELWPNRRFVTTHLIVNTEFLATYPGTVKAVLEGLVASLGLIEDDPATAQAAVNADIEAVTGSAIPPEVLEASWANLVFTVDPVASSLHGSAAHAVATGLLDPVQLDGIYNLTLLNEVLAERGLEQVAE